ncbi:MAG: hypothetical protein U9R44_04840 [Candidatus Omnitrophota bacterium]|nr:hypothetical protein [Candidatus Omnitrophota bacterium]
MLDSSIRVLNFDDSVVRQEKLLAVYKAEVIELKDIAPEARFWLSGKTGDEITRRVSSFSKSSVTFLGSGDFHHISNILINAVEGPLTVINFDFHPDWNIFPSCLSCGSWVTETLKNNSVVKFVLVGMCSGKASSFSVQAGNYASLEDDRVEIYPWSQCPSVAFFRRVPRNISVKAENRRFFTKIYWNELKGKNLTEFLLDVFKRLPARRVYVSIDKDCLQKRYSLTNWQEGQLSMDDLLLMLKLIKQHLDIVGADISGDYSEIFIKGPIKKIVSRVNHPKEFSARGFSQSRITGMNEDTNLKIMKLLTG